jgi:DNA-binding transcriptional LysR family regulator
MNLTIRQLETFRAVMRAGSISEAARRLGRTQPAVSAALAGLEDELGFKLFERSKKRLVARPEAHYFLEEAAHVLDRLAQSARTMREIGNLERGRLRIACHPASSNFIVPRIVADFLETRPDVKVSLMMRSSAIIEEWIASQQYDIGIAEASGNERSAIDQQVFNLRCLCAVRADDPLAKLRKLSPGHLDGKPMAALFEEHPVTIETSNAFAQAGARFNARFELRTFQAAMELVERGLCYMICDPITSESYASYAPERPRVKFLKFEPAIPYPLALMTPAHRPLSELALAFRDLVAAEIRSMGRGRVA